MRNLIIRPCIRTLLKDPRSQVIVEKKGWHCFSMSDRKIKIILLIASLSLVLDWLYVHFHGVPKEYFLALNYYIYIIGFLIILVALSLLFRPLSNAGQVLAVILLFFTGYALLEIIYFKFPLILPSDPHNRMTNLIYGDLTLYFFHRCYQYIPIAILIIVLFPTGRERLESLVKAGNWNILTGILDSKNPRSWEGVVRRIGLMTLCLAVIALLLRLKLHNLMRPFEDQAVLFPSNVLGAVNNCFIEELIFRGIFLSVFVKALGVRWGVFLQALLFGLVHFPSFNPLHYLAKVVVFTFLGWLFGRASVETGGIKTSWCLHSIIVISMYVAQTV